MAKRSKAFSILVVVAFSQILFVRDAYAYLDPGTGSLIFQMVVAAIVGTGAALRIYWRQVKAFFSRSKAGSEASETRPVESGETAKDPRGES